MGMKLPNWDIVAVDFDGTLVKQEYPEIGETNQDIVDFIKMLQENGSRIVLHTCRVNGNRHYLDEAVHWCEEHGIKLYGVNLSEEDTKFNEALGQKEVDVKKPFADAYIDDKAIPTTLIYEWMDMYHKLQEVNE